MFGTVNECDSPQHCLSFVQILSFFFNLSFLIHIGVMPCFNLVTLKQ